MELLNACNMTALMLCEDASVDAVVTDPPYGLSFMGKKWDYDVPSVELWREVFRVLKPGGYLLSFGGTRTYHRLVTAIEDAGFEIRDQIQWIYGSGFPKSMDVSKGIDRLAGAKREIVGKISSFRTAQLETSANYTARKYSGDDNLTAPATDEAIKWQGFGTALKPANEPIVLARKPLSESTVAKNVLKHGTGALNIDGTRIEAADQAVLDAAVKRMTGNAAVGWKNTSSEGIKPNSAQGRWPANVLFDEEAARMLDEQSGQFKGSIGRANRKSAGNYEASSFKVGVVTETEVKDFGGASRFFYVAKASKRERNAGLEGMPEKDAPGSKRSTPAEGRTSALGAPRANHHPTVKPIKLMEYLCKLITPPGGIILDPFMGSGSTGIAAKNLKFNFLGIEIDEDYFKIASKRIGEAHGRQ